MLNCLQSTRPRRAIPGTSKQKKARRLSRAIAMRAYAVSILLIIACAGAAATAADLIQDALSILGDTPSTKQLATCTKDLGPLACLRSVAVWRANRATVNNTHSFAEDLMTFPVESYRNLTDEALGGQLCDGTAKLLSFRSMKFLLPGYIIEMASKRNRTLRFDFIKVAEEDARSSTKKLRKQFYNIVPLLLIPGLIMSAILPFVLPALKMATMGVGMLNQMALTGAIFTLMRNNAFSDSYSKKVVYVNEGYKREKKKEPVFYEEEEEQSGYPVVNFDELYQDTDQIPHASVAHQHYLEPVETIGNIKRNQEVGKTSTAKEKDVESEKKPFTLVVDDKTRRSAQHEIRTRFKLKPH